MILTRTTRNFAIDSMPLLAEVVLNAFEAVESRHFLGTLVRARLAPRVMGRVLVLHLGRR